MLSEPKLRAALREHRFVRLPRQPDTRESAVAIVVRFVPNAEVLLMKRAEAPDDKWSGHMSFPGGRRERHDTDLSATATRETLEEVGLDLTVHGEQVGLLDEIQAIGEGTPLNMLIAPVVFIVAEPGVAIAPGDEATEVMWSPLGPMERGETRTTLLYDYRGRSIEMPGFRVREHIVWGLTYRMLEAFFRVVRGRRSEPIG